MVMEVQDPQEVSCGLCCLNVKKLVDSHIFPQWMGKEVRDGGILMSIATHPEHAPGLVVRNGIYDQIVCQSCEEEFGPPDAYFAKFSRARDSAEILRAGEASIHVYDGWNQALIQRFALVCVLRAHLSTRPEFARFDLGPHVVRVRDALQGKAVEVLPEFEVVMMRESHVLSDAIVAPIRKRIEGTNVVRFSVPGFGFIVGMDQSVLPKELGIAALGRHAQVFAPEMDTVHKDLMGAMGKAMGYHSEQIDRIIAVDSRRGKPR